MPIACKKSCETRREKEEFVSSLKAKPPSASATPLTIDILGPEEDHKKETIFESGRAKMRGGR